MATDIYQHLQELPYRRYVDVLRNRVNDLNRKLTDGIGVGVGASGAAYLDQYPGKVVPWMFSKLYTFGMVKPGNGVGGAGFDTLAPLATPGTFILPRGDNILTGREAAFYWCSTTVAGFISWTYTSAPGFTAPIDTKPVADIFDSAIQQNGGAQVWQNFSGVDIAQEAPRICFEIELYDQKRGRSLTDGKMPAEVYLGGAYEFKKHSRPVRFDVDTQIEPRVYLNEVKMTSALDTATPYNAAQVRCYLNIVWKGYYALDQHRKETP